jgi:hypothetical protein
LVRESFVSRSGVLSHSYVTEVIEVRQLLFMTYRIYLRL